jgi:hypothetical protein
MKQKMFQATTIGTNESWELCCAEKVLEKSVKQELYWIKIKLHSKFFSPTNTPFIEHIKC